MVLDPRLQPAALHEISVISGPPGSGKSRALVDRMLAAGEPALILAVTARNRQRLESYLAAAAGEQPHAVKVQTLEQFLLEALQAHDPAWSLLEDGEALWMTAGLLSESHPQTARLDSRALARHVWDWMRPLLQAGISPQALPASVPGSRLHWLGTLYRRFLEVSETQRLLPHAALPWRVRALWQTQPERAAATSARFKLMGVDEAQELSDTHYELLQCLACPLVLAGDHRLSIRSFRHAHPDRFAQLPAETPLAECFRGNEPALYWAGKLLPVPLLDGKPTAGSFQMQCLTLPDPGEEARALAHWIKRMQAHALVHDPDGPSRPARWTDFVVLMRSARYKPILLQGLRDAGIPVQEVPESERLFDVRHSLYDLLSLFEALSLLEEASSERIRQEMTRRANRHAARYLAFSWQDPLLHLHSEDQDFLLVAEAETRDPAAAQAVRELKSLWEDYRPGSSVHDVAVSLLPDPQPDEVRWLEALAQFEARHRQWMKAPLDSNTLLAWYQAWEETAPVRDGVRLLSCHQVQGEEFPFVAIPFLVCGEWHRESTGAEMLDLEDRRRLSETLGVSWPEGAADSAEEARLLAMGLTRARQGVIVSCHQQDTGEPVLVSPFFHTLVSALESPPVDVPGPAETASREAHRFEGDSTWAELAAQPAENLFEPDETLYLSASHLKTWMTCPRQFFYKHLLKLHAGDSPEATLGSLIHKLFEVFNRQAGDEPYTAGRLRTLACKMFETMDDAEAFSEAGFDPTDLRRLHGLGPLARHDLRQRLLQSIEDLEAQGYFRRYGEVKSIQPERELLGVSVPGIENCQFKMALDAVMELPDGRWEIIDYKTYRNAYGHTAVATCESNFKKTLEPLPEDALSHRERFRSKLSPVYPQDYQLPLYYLASRQLPEYQGRLRGVAMQIVRPAIPDPPGQGAIRLELTAEEIEAQADQLTHDINRYLIQPLRGSTVFYTNPDPTACRQCGFFDICEANGEDALEEADA